MKFITFIQALEKSLGYHHIPLNRDAQTLRDLFDGTAVQSEFTIKFVRTVYKENNCASLEAKITKTVTENVLAKTRLTALQSKNIDIDTFNFIEDLCVAIDIIFKKSTSQQRNSKKTKTGQVQKIDNTQEDSQSKKSSVVSINQKRHLRWLKSSA